MKNKYLIWVACFVLGLGISFFFNRMNDKTEDSDNKTPITNTSGVVAVPDNYGQPDEVIDGFNRGDIDQLSKYFGEDMELGLLGEEDFYSKEEASAKLRQFFVNYPPEGFTIQHRGQSKGGENSYLIGNYRSGTLAYRSYIAYEEGNIVEIRIEQRK